MTLGGLLALGYNVVVIYKRASKSIINGNLSISLETIDTLAETYIVLRGRDRKMVEAEASRLGITAPWITKSYLEMILDSQVDFKLIDATADRLNGYIAGAEFQDLRVKILSAKD